MTHNHSWAPKIEKVSDTRHLTTRNQQQTDSDTPQPTANTRQPTLETRQPTTSKYNRQIQLTNKANGKAKTKMRTLSIDGNLRKCPSMNDFTKTFVKIPPIFLISRNINNYNFSLSLVTGHKFKADNVETRTKLPFSLDNETLSVTNLKSTTTSQIGNFYLQIDKRLPTMSIDKFVESPI